MRIERGWLLLCNVFQNMMTGEVTYEPVQLKDLPVIDGEGKRVIQ